MIVLCEKDKLQLIATGQTRNVYLEGNIIKLIDAQDDDQFKKYLTEAKTQDRSNRKKRLEVTKQVQIQNRELIASQEKNEKLLVELKEAVKKADEAKDAALNDLDLMQKKTQFELIGKIVQVALWIIIGVGVFTTGLFMFSMYTGIDTTLIGNTWSNLFGILLTNSFSIIGTIMGVKYASEGKEK
jgi:hypothetical protein